MTWFTFALATAFFWGTAPILAKLGLARVEPLTALSIRTFGVAVALAAINLLGGTLPKIRAVEPRAWAFLLAEGAMASLLGHYAYFYALKFGKASSVVPVTAAYPLVAALIGWMVLHEHLSPGKIAGGLLVALGVILIKQF